MNASDFAARGKILEIRDGGELVVFQPANTTYEMHLKPAAEPAADAPTHTPVRARVRLKARKVYTVPSGGGFIVPIFGPPRIVQGRVRYADDQQLVVQAAASAMILVDLPTPDTAIDLTEGRIRVGHMVNVVALPGATFHLAAEPAAQPDAAAAVATTTTTM